jgi:hypothetical protein
MLCSFEKEQRLQHLPPSPNVNARRPAAHGGAVAIPTTEEHRDQDELDATADWLAHLAAGHISVRQLARAR